MLITNLFFSRQLSHPSPLPKLAWLYPGLSALQLDLLPHAPLHWGVSSLDLLLGMWECILCPGKENSFPWTELDISIADCHVCDCIFHQIKFIGLHYINDMKCIRSKTITSPVPIRYCRLAFTLPSLLNSKLLRLWIPTIFSVALNASSLLRSRTPTATTVPRTPIYI